LKAGTASAKAALAGLRESDGQKDRHFEMLKLKASVIVAKCPQDLASNAWYEKRGFICLRVETTRSGRKLNIWQLSESIGATPCQ
jgi:hypothetical protein